MITIESFSRAVQTSARKETSATPDLWSEDNPTFGHCAIVSLVAQDIFGGDLLRASLIGTEFAESGSHYWNLLPDGTEKDFTEAQFEGNKPKLVGEVRTRDQVLSYEPTRLRYELLKNIIAQEFHNISPS